MNYLVDTHYLLWALMYPDRIERRTRKAMRDAEDLLRLAGESGFALLSLDGEVVSSYHRFPSVDNHKDPFDRILIWQCIETKSTTLSADR